jgi:hypothetical protein
MKRIGSGCLLRSIRSWPQDWHQSEYRPTDARSEISIRPSRPLFFKLDVLSPRSMTGSYSVAWRACSIVLVDSIVRPSPTRTPSSMNLAGRAPYACRSFGSRRNRCSR